MRRARTRTVVATAGITALLALPVGVGTSQATAPAKKPPKVSATKDLASLATLTGKLPRKVLTDKQRTSLIALSLHAKASAAKAPCAAVKDLAAFRTTLHKAKVSTKLTKKVQTKERKRLATLSSASLRASSKLLASPKTKKCGGGVAPSTLPAAVSQVHASTVNALTVHVDLPALTFADRTGGGRTWTEITLPGVTPGGTPGTPGIPAVASAFAIPDGASVRLSAKPTSSYTIGGVDLYPVQPEAVDGSPFDSGPFVHHGFTVDPKAYSATGLSPAITGGSVGTYRDITLGSMQVPAAQYDPSKRSLKVVTGVDVSVTFTGGSRTFSPRLSSPWELGQRRLVTGLLNAEVPLSAQRSDNEGDPAACGEEYLIISRYATVDPARILSETKEAQGYRTQTVMVADGIEGAIAIDAKAIQTYIRGELTKVGCIHPSYVAILGDDDMIPTFTDGPESIPSDLKYALSDDKDELPDVAVGRILGHTFVEVVHAVDKIVHYETVPPTDLDYLHHATVAGLFQDVEPGQTPADVADGTETRTFISYTEQIRKALLKRNLTVDRIYTTDGAAIVPKKFHDGTALPAELLKPTFSWNGSGADVTAAWNDGRFLFIHRDHGSHDSWGDPSYNTTDVQALTNNNDHLPVLLSINCASGRYDDDNDSFVAQALVKKDGGAVAVFGDTRNSPSDANSVIALGFADGLLPTILPGEGSSTPLRMGEALTYGKVRMAGLLPPSKPTKDVNASREELYLWHFFGDPAMKMWGGGPEPKKLAVSTITATYKPATDTPGPDPLYNVAVTLPQELAGQSVSLLHDGEVVGKAIIGAGAGTGTALIAARFGSAEVKPGSLSVVLDADNTAPVSAPVGGVPTSLSLTSPASIYANHDLVASGTLTGAPAGSAVTVTYTRPDTTTQVVGATTASDGSFSTAVPVTDANLGVWHVQAFFAGSALSAPSASAVSATQVNHSQKD